MQITVENTASDGSALFDLVLVQGQNTIRLGIFANSQFEADDTAGQLSQWIEDNVIDVVEIVRAKA